MKKFTQHSICVMLICLLAFTGTKQLNAQSGNSLNFDGSNDYVNCTNNSSFQISQGTVEAWIKTSNAGTSFRGIVVKQGAYGLFLVGNVLQLWDWGGSTARNTGVSLGDNQWHHVALTFNSGVTNGTVVYVDGVAKLTTTITVADQTKELAIGAGVYPTSISQVFTGNIDEVRIWNTIRTASQIQNQMNIAINTAASGLVAYYNFNAGTAGATNTGVTTLADQTGNTSLNGTLNNFALTGSVSNWVGGVTVNPCTSTTSITNVSICPSALPYNWNGSRAAAGTYTFTTTNSQGCDSVATLNLTVSSTTSSTTNVSICPSALPYSWNGSRTAAGTYTFTTTNSQGCDSVATLNLSLKTNTTSTTNVSICPSALPYNWNGSRASAGTYTFTTTNSQGCDSVATLNLSLKTNTTSTTNVSICPSQLPYSWNGSRASAGTYTFTTTNSQGCDSTATLNLTLKSNTTSTTNVSICQSALPYNWNGSRTTAGTYTFTTTNSQGCDSVATLNLTVSSTTSSTTNVTNCGSYTWNGTTYSNSGTYNKLFTGSGGCDSIATLNLTVITSLPAIAGANAVCSGSTLTLTNTITGGIWYTQQTSQATINPSTGLVTAKSAGNIIVEYSKTGCSSVSKTITVNPIAPVPTIAYASGTNYTLFRYSGDFCKGKSFSVVGNPAGGSWDYTNPLVGTINSAGFVNLIGVGSGAIVYTITDAKGCKNSRTILGNVANCPMPKGVNSNEQLATSNDFTMFPNPARTFISLNVNMLIGKGQIVVTDLYGKTVKTQPLSMGTNTINTSSLSKGMYMVSVITEQGKQTKKVVIE